MTLASTFNTFNDFQLILLSTGKQEIKQIWHNKKSIPRIRFSEVPEKQKINFLGLT